MNEKQAQDSVNIEIPQIKLNDNQSEQKQSSIHIEHSIKKENENSKIQLFKLLETIREDPEKFAGEIFNDKMAADAILQIDMKELNENTVRQEEILEQL